MLAILHLLGMFIVDVFKSRRRLQAENLFLRHQLSIALRRAPPRLRLRGSDRALSRTDAKTCFEVCKGDAVGLHEPGSGFSVGFNKGVWDSFTASEQKII